MERGVFSTRMKWFFSIFLAVILIACSKEPPSIFSHTRDGETFNSFVACNRESVKKDEKIVAYIYSIEYKSSNDFTIEFTDSTLTASKFKEPNIEVTYKIHQNDSVLIYKYATGWVELEVRERKEELKGTFEFTLVNENDSTDFIKIEDGKYHGRFSQTFSGQAL